MSAKKEYNFGEKTEEYSTKHCKKLPVWKSPKYEEAKRKAIEMLESEQYKNILSEADFWILMNTTKNDQMAYTGLIISHNGCLKINDVLPDELKFNPKCVNFYEPDDVRTTYNNSLIFVYDSSVLENDMQRIYEIGEVSSKNCNNDYPYAMALKRCMDRVILKNSKLAYSGIYSDSEAEEFKQPDEKSEEPAKEVAKEVANSCKKETKFIRATDKQLEMIKNIFADRIDELQNILAGLNKIKIVELSVQEASDIIKNDKEQSPGNFYEVQE